MRRDVGRDVANPLGRVELLVIRVLGIQIVHYSLFGA
jgi:hypothetical protein